MERRWQIALGVAAGGLGALVGVALARRHFFERTVSAEVEWLHTELAARPDRVIEEGELEGLPEPVERYLRYAGVIGKRPVRSVQVGQTGEFRMYIGKKWMPFEAVEYYSAAPPGFVWYADVHAAPLLSFKVRDHFLAGHGAIRGELAGALPMVVADGPPVDQGSAMRFLNEMVFFPTAFLEDYVSWEGIDDHVARVTMKHWGGDVSADCYFAPDGRMVDFVALRYRDEGDAPRLCEWRTPFGDYVEADGFRVPGSGSGIWSLEEGDFEYIRLRVDTISYDNVEKL